eukprot:TRINITY_DN45515_c0_g1_i3.p1 TRINITY_DN45515_c0_g1~~TRINITY_DN45515_c0_g1_i3.p1  ORF type:complete len:130 (-),score=16.59 TRINITY_DN45515_c0_g1_i3:37-426(-)
MASVAAQRRLRNSRSVKEILEIVRDCGDDFDPINSTTSLFKLAKRKRDIHGNVSEVVAPALHIHVAQLRRIEEQAQPRPTGYAQMLANTVWACAALEVRHDELLALSSRSSQAGIHEFGALDLGNLVSR